jgi:NAD(P)-dependent dehydrogenase (short-subunit alcohol dehydrogenase family)
VATRTVLVTGATRGLGKALVEHFLNAGHTVIGCGRGETTVTHERYTHWRLDVTDATAVSGMFTELKRTVVTLDVLVNNAGVDLTVPFETLGVEDWDRIVGVNLRGPFLMAREAFPIMRRRGRGHIVNIVSTAAKRAWANAAAYHASKWGLLGLSHALHVEGRPHGVKVTAVVAGGMRTPFLLERFPDLDPGVLQDPGHVAATVVFVLTQPAETVVPEVTVLPMRETSWP